jgi:cysteine desulfurase/selenocysteine lyase
MTAGIDIDAVRALMPIARRYVYMNHAAIGPLPQTAVDRAAGVARSVAETGDEYWPARLSEAERVRALAARLMGARVPHEVAFVANTSDGLSVVATGIDWRSGDNVVGADCEFPANVYPWMRLAALGVEYRRAPERDGRLDLDELLSLVDDRTRVVALSWVQFASGFRADLRRIGAYCRERGVVFVVDGIQGLGALEIDVERDNVDVLAADGHKWLLAPEGIGLLYVSDRVVDRIEPSRVGWTSVRDWLKWTRYELRYREGAGRYEPGTLNMLGVYALGASLELLLEAGPAAIEARIKSLTDALVDGLTDRGFEVVSSRRDGEWSGVVAVTHPARPSPELVERLHARGIEVAHRAGRVRISPHFYNTHEEVGRVLEGVEG